MRKYSLEKGRPRSRTGQGKDLKQGCVHPKSSFSVSYGALLVAQTVKNLPAMQETSVQSLGWEDPMEEGVATHSSTLACRFPWTEEPGGL